MARHKVLASWQTKCPHCGGKDMWFVGLFRVDENVVYIMTQCNNEGCGKTYPIKVDDAIIELYSALITPCSKIIN